jgi:hypothetical protein
MKLGASTFSRNCASLKMRRVSPFSLSTIVRGVPFGANSPYQEPAS